MFLENHRQQLQKEPAISGDAVGVKRLGLYETAKTAGAERAEPSIILLY